MCCQLTCTRRRLPLPPRVTAGEGGASIRSIMEEAHCHQHPIPPLHSSSSLSLLRPTTTEHPRSPPSPYPPTLNTPQLIPHFILLPLLTRKLPSSRWSCGHSSPPSGCRTTSRTVTSVVMNVSVARAARGEVLLTFATSPSPGCSPPRCHPARTSRGGVSRARWRSSTIPSPPPSRHPRSATFWQKFGWRGSVRLGVRVRWSRPADRPRAHPHFFPIFTPTHPSKALTLHQQRQRVCAVTPHDMNRSLPREVQSEGRKNEENEAGSDALAPHRFVSGSALPAQLCYVRAATTRIYKPFPPPLLHPTA